jgi:hypothetical protein
VNGYLLFIELHSPYSDPQKSQIANKKSQMTRPEIWLARKHSGCYTTPFILCDSGWSELEE